MKKIDVNDFFIDSFLRSIDKKTKKKKEKKVKAVVENNYIPSEEDIVKDLEEVEWETIGQNQKYIECPSVEITFN